MGCLRCMDDRSLRKEGLAVYPVQQKESVRCRRTCHFQAGVRMFFRDLCTDSLRQNRCRHGECESCVRTRHDRTALPDRWLWNAAKYHPAILPVQIGVLI